METLSTLPSLGYSLHGGGSESSSQGDEEQPKTLTQTQQSSAPPADAAIAADDPSSSSDEEDEEIKLLFRAEKQGRPAAEILSVAKASAEPGDPKAAEASERQPTAPASKADGASLAALDALLEDAGPASQHSEAESQRGEAEAHGRGAESQEEAEKKEKKEKKAQQFAGEAESQGDEPQEFVHEGVTYLRDRDGEVIDPRTDERVGEWASGTIEWEHEEAKEQHERHVDFQPPPRPSKRRKVASPAANQRGGAEVIDCDEEWEAMELDEEQEALKLSLKPAGEVFGATGSSHSESADEAYARRLQEEENRRAHPQARAAGMGHGGAVIDDEAYARRLQEEENRRAHPQATAPQQFQHAHHNRPWDGAAAAAAAPAAPAGPPVQRIKFLSYNLWFDESNRAGRMRGIVDIIREKKPHIVAFQEVIPDFVSLLRPALRAIGFQLELQNGGQDPYFVGLAVRTPLKLDSVTFQPFPNSAMGRGLLSGVVTGAAGTGPILAGSVHLESWMGPKNPGTRERADQLLQCLKMIDSTAKQRGAQNALLMGDMNWNDKTDGDMAQPLQAAEQGSQRSGPGWSVRDVWSELNPGDRGMTYDGKLNPMLANNLQGRFDRAVFVSRIRKADSGWKPASIGLCGKKPLDGLQRQLKNRTLPVLPSDHFGLLGVLKFSESSPKFSAPAAPVAARQPQRTEAAPIQVKVRLVRPNAVLLSGRGEFTLSLLPADTVCTVRARISSEVGDIDVAQIKLIHNGAQLNIEEDARTIVTVKLEQHSEIVAVLPSTTTAATVPSTTTTTTTTTTTVRLNVKLVINSKPREMEVQVALHQCVADLKRTLSAQIYIDANVACSPAQLTLIHGGDQLQDESKALRELGFKDSEKLVAVLTAKAKASGASADGGGGRRDGDALARTGGAPDPSARVCWDSTTSEQTVQQFCAEYPPSSTRGTRDGWIWLENSERQKQKRGVDSTDRSRSKPDYESILAPMRDANRAGRSRKQKEKDSTVLQLLQAAKSDGDTSGKFMLMPHRRHVDAVWDLVATYFADGKLGQAAKITSADEGESAGGGTQQANTHVICVYVDWSDVDMVKSVAKSVFSINKKLPSGCKKFDGKIKPDIFTSLGLNSGNDCKLPVTSSAFYSPQLSEAFGEKVRALLTDEATALGGGGGGGATVGVAAAAGRERVRSVRTEIVGVNHSAKEGHMVRDGGSGPRELRFVRDPSNKYDANAICVRLDGSRVGFLPKRLAQSLAPAMDASAVDVSLKMDGGAWQYNTKTLDELGKLRQDVKRDVPHSCDVTLLFRMDAGDEVASQLAVSQLHDGLDGMQ